MQWLYGSQIRWIKLHRAQHVFTYIFYEHIVSYVVVPYLH